MKSPKNCQTNPNEIINNKPFSKKTKNFLQNTKDAVKKALMTTGVAGSLLGGNIGTGVTGSALIPEAATTITAMTPQIGIATKTITLGTATALASACCEKLDTTAPSIDIVQPQVDISGGETLRISRNNIYIGDVLVFACSDNISQTLNISATFNSKSIYPGYIFEEGGALSIKATDEANNSKSATTNINFIDNHKIYGIENLNKLNLKVDQEVDLLNGITFPSEGKVSVKIQINGETHDIEDPYHYTPNYPGTCTIIINVELPDGTQIQEQSNNLTISPLEYNAIIPQETNIYENRNERKNNVVGHKIRYRFFENVGHLHTRKIVSELQKLGSSEYKEQLNDIQLIGLGEQPTDTCTYIAGTREIGETIYPDAHKSDHADRMSQAIKTNGTSIPGIAQNYDKKIIRIPYARRTQLLNYAKNNPNKKIIFFCATDRLAGASANANPKGTEEGNALQEVVNLDNCLTIIAVGNTRQSIDYTLEQNQPYQERSRYNASSVQGKYSIAAIGGTDTGVTLRDYNIDPYEHSATPIGFDQKNIKVSSGSYPAHGHGYLGAAGNEASSRPTAELAGTMRNILALDPSMSIGELMDLINTRSISIPATHNGATIENFNTPNQKDICKAICLPTMPSSLSSSEITTLPRDSKYPAVLWTGKGVEYLDNGEWKPAENISSPDKIFQISKNSQFRFNPTLWKKQGGKDGVELKSQAITSDGESIPEIMASKNVTVN